LIVTLILGRSPIVKKGNLKIVCIFILKDVWEEKELTFSSVIENRKR
jgi:hypothetical protein